MPDLAHQFRAGNPETLRMLANTMTPKMLRLARIYTVSVEDAEDLVQRAWHQILRRRRRFQGGGSPAAWMMSVTRSVCKDWARRRKRRHPMIPVPEVNLDPRTEQAGSPTNLAEALYGQFHNLPEAEQQAVGLRFVAEMTTEEAAQIMRITESSFLVCISRAMARLSDLAADKGAA